MYQDPVCSGGACGFECSPGHDDCNGLPGDGCEVNLDTDQHHCGDCSRDCLVTSCASGFCSVVMENAGAYITSTLAIDKATDDLYWGDANGDVRKRSGGTNMTVASGQGNVKWAFYDTEFCWTVLQNFSGTDYGDVRCWNGSSVYTPISLKQGLGVGTNPVHVNSTYAYWQSEVTLPAKLYATPMGGGSDELVYTFPWGERSDSIHADGANVYWTNWNAATVSKASVGTWVVTPLATSQGDPFKLAADGLGFLYWLNTAVPRSIMKVNVATGVPTNLGSPTDFPTTITTDGSFVYWHTANSTVERVSVNGGPVTTLTKVATSAENIVVGSSYVYWTNGQYIYAVAK